jgi:methionine-rich copper-binding protein CopC
VYGAAGAFPTSSYNNANYWVDVVYARTPPPDTTAPRLVGRSPAANASGVGLSTAVTATFSEGIQAGTLAFTLRDGAGAAVAGAVAYDAASRTATLTPASRLALDKTYTATVSGAADAAGNAMAADSWSFSTPACPCTVWPDTATPAVPSVGAGGPIEFGVKFRTEVDGYVTGVRFYKGAGNTGTHVGHLWSASGAPLASATFADETASGWQQVSFFPAVAVTANTTYVASYFAPNAGYAYDGGYFYTGPPVYPTGRGSVVRGPLTALAWGADGPNGLYRTGASGFPTGSYNGNNYWVDPVFATAPPPDTTAPKLIARAPANGAADAGLGAAVTATFSEPIQAGTLRFTLRDGAGAAIAGSAAYDPATSTATLTPSAKLIPGTTYTVEVGGAPDLAGNAMATEAWSFSTPACPCTLFADAAAPAAFATGGGALELGVTFASEVDGYVTGLRFYKGPGNTGTHLGRLWTGGGQLLADATFIDETDSGWQTVTFSPAVAVAAGQTYVASYTTPKGAYAYDGAYFARPVARGPLRATDSGSPGNNGVYGAAGAFPTSSYNQTNYWVDPVFAPMPPPDTTAPKLIARWPGAGEQGVFPSENVFVTFSETIQADTLRFVLRDSSGAAVAAVPTYDPATRKATLNPSVGLGLGASYTVEVSAALDLAGNAMATESWSFSTVPPATDTRPPYLMDRFPAAGRTDVGMRSKLQAYFDGPIQQSSLTFTLKDAAGVTVVGTVHYAPDLLLAEFYPSGTLAMGASYTATVAATDVPGNAMAPDSWSFTVGACPCSFWAGNPTPAVTTLQGGGPIELGLRFTSRVDGYVTGVRFYKGPHNTGTHTGSLWTGGGTLLATATFSDETATGWQQVSFSSPVRILPNTTYVVSYYAPAGGYAYNPGFFPTDWPAPPVTIGPLEAPYSAVTGTAGVYRYGASGFPEYSYNHTNYWVDVVFSTTP